MRRANKKGNAMFASSAWSSAMLATQRREGDAASGEAADPMTGKAGKGKRGRAEKGKRAED